MLKKNIKTPEPNKKKGTKKKGNAKK